MVSHPSSGWASTCSTECSPAAHATTTETPSARMVATAIDTRRRRRCVGRAFSPPVDTPLPTLTDHVLSYFPEIAPRKLSAFDAVISAPTVPAVRLEVDGGDPFG